MYGPGQPRPPQPPGGAPGYGTGTGYPQHGAGPYAPPGPQGRPGPWPQQPGGPFPRQQPAPAPARRRRTGADSRLPVFAVVVVLVATGLTNAVWAPFTYLHDGFLGVTVVAGNALFLAAAQLVCGVALAAFGVLILFRRPFAWGGALTSAGVFAVLEGFDVARGALTHFVGLFLVVVVCALLNLDAVRRFCRVGPPSR
ncbi:MAG TPA: hypothetical protein VF053_12715 [Streptosporangiales bacterium]